EIDKGAERLISLVDDLLELAAIESGKRAPVLGPVDILKLAKEAASSLAPQAERRKVSIRIEPSAVPLLIRADKAQLLRVLTNLIDNAIKFNREKGTVRVEAEEKAGFVAVWVRDTGPGIPPEDLQRIFERFYRVEKARSAETGGTGLGLSIV